MRWAVALITAAAIGGADQTPPQPLNPADIAPPYGVLTYADVEAFTAYFRGEEPDFAGVRPVLTIPGQTPFLVVWGVWEGEPIPLHVNIGGGGTWFPVTEGD